MEAENTEQQIDKGALITMRLGFEDDNNFILSTWLRGLYYGESWFSLIDKKAFMKNYHTFLEQLLASDLVNVRVACLKDDPEVILGYAVVSSDHAAVHWVFTKSAWRNIGIAKMLVPKEVHTATHATKLGLRLMKSKGYTFNPFYNPLKGE